MSGTGSVEGMAQPGHDRGATLLEMLVVLGILALATSLVFPNFRRPYRTLAAETASASVAADLRSARAEAIRTDTSVALQVSPDGREYGWAGRRMRLPAGARLVSDPGEVVFGPDGSSAGARLAVLDTTGRRFAVWVEAPAGVVQIERAHGAAAL